MTYKVSLEIKGVSLEDDSDLIAQLLGDLSWSESAGRVIAAVFTDESDPCCAAIDAASRICHAVPGASVQRLDEDFVGLTDIANLAKVTREAVRMWVTGQRGPGDFPKARGQIGSGSDSKLWAWSDVNRWLDEHYCLGDGYAYLDFHDTARLNAHLAHAEPLA